MSPITYDAIGNPLTYDGWTYTWQNGRQLATASNGATSLSYKYNADGIRTKKTVNGTATEYFLNGSQILAQKTGNDIIWFYYDHSGTRIAFEYNGNLYYYIYNLQGDVIGIANSSGSLVGTYTYNDWGKILSVNNLTTDNIATVNPFRYRGYYYDSETELYYLNSRYYNPDWGRFVNADEIGYLGADGTLISYNLFAYCGNNPTMGYDPEGTWNWGGVLVGLGIVVATVITVATFGVGTGLGVVVAAAAITTGASMMFSAATDSAMVIDLSVSVPVRGKKYAKVGASLVTDFSEENGGIYGYGHVGGGVGCSTGLSYSTGIVENFKTPNDYSKHFIDVNVGSKFGIDHCFDPTRPYAISTKATSATFGCGYNYGAGYDYYLNPLIIAKWRRR